MPEDSTPPVIARVRPGAWSPTGIALISLILSPLAGGVLYGLNDRKLGRARTWRLAFLTSVIATALVALFRIATDDRLPGAGPVTHLLFAAFFYKAQAAPFARHLQAGGRKASLMLPVLLTLLVVGLLLGGGFVLSGG